MKRLISVLMMALMALALTMVSGCGGGGSTAASSSGTGGGGGTGGTSSSTGTVSAVTVTKKVSVVDPGTSTLATKVSALKFFNKLISIKSSTIDPSGFSSSSDYGKDQTQVYVHDQTSQSFKTVNMILCMMGQLKYDAMLNKGNYVALVDQNVCSSNRDSASTNSQNSNNESGASSAPNYMTWIVNSTRADNSSPEVVETWVHQPEQGQQNQPGYQPAMMIYAKATVTNGVSSANPFGLFSLNYEGHMVNQDGSVNPQIAMNGHLGTTVDATGKVILQYYESDANPQYNGNDTYAAALSRSSDGSSGDGTVAQTFPAGDTYDKSGQTNFAFNSSYFYRGSSVNNATCFDRTHFNESAWSYGLYNSTGGHVNVNSGFPVTDSNGDQGFIGYWGMMLDNPTATITDGMALTEQTFNGGAAKTGTLLLRKGRLMKYTRKNMTLGQMADIPFMYYDQSLNNGQGGQIQAIWNSTSSEFEETGTQNTNNPGMFTPVPNTPLPLTSLQGTQINAYSQALNGNVNVMLPAPGAIDNGTGSCTQNQDYTFSCTATNKTPVYFYTQSLVLPGDTTVPGNLVCTDQCPDPSSFTNSSATSAYFGGGFSQPGTSYTASYTFNTTANDSDPASMVLVSGTTPVVFPGSGGNSALEQQGGIMSGPLFANTPANKAALACPWDTSGTQICGWQAWTNLSTFYQWQTGGNQWNWLTAFIDSNGNVLSFDPPVSVNFEGDGTNGTTNGTTYVLNYSGFGQLNGIPGQCVDKDGNTVACGPNVRWVPAFNLQAGTNVTDANSGANYVVKPLQVEERMRKMSQSDCAGLSLTGYTLPGASLYTAPNIGTQPVVTSAPAVIGGIVQ